MEIMFKSALKSSKSFFQATMATTGREQLRLAIGIINSRNTEWELPFRQMLNFEELTKTTLRSSKFHRGNLKERGRVCLDNLEDEVEKLARDDEVFNLMLMVTSLKIRNDNCSAVFN